MAEPLTPCNSCGERPATVGLVLATPQGRRHLALCESCARNLAGPQAPQPPRDEQRDASQTPNLDHFGRAPTAEARAGNIDPVIGREAEIAQTVEVLARRRKNNAVLIGEAGVGKTAIVEGLARRIVEGDVPAALHDVRVVALDLAGMVAGSQYR